MSVSVLDAIARALQLDDAERAHLFHLAHAADGTSASMRPRRRPSPRWTPQPSLQWVLDKFTAPAIVRNGRMDLLAANHLGRAMHTSLFAVAGDQPNFARFTFLNTDAAHDFYPDWDTAADTCVAILRTEAGRDPHDKQLHDLVGAAVHPQRGLPTPVELTQRPAARRRHQTVPPHPGRRPHAGLRKPRHGLRTRPHAHPLCRRASVANGASP